jgi:trimeric autotransporter adhesin
MKTWLAMIGAAILIVVIVHPSLYVQAAGAQQASAATAQETVPRLVQFNGTLKDTAARPVSGVASVTFAIYAEQDGGAALWSETQNVLADTNGHFNVLLGAVTTGGFPAELFGTGQSRWLGVTIARQPEMSRVLLASVPYALKAGDADTLGGLPASSYVTTQQLAASNAKPAGSFLNGGGTTVVATSGIATASAAAGPISTGAAQTSAIDATPTGSGTTDYIPLWTSGSNLGNSILFQTGGKIGVGITAPLSTLDINGGEILRGGFYEYPQGTATASAGQPSHSFQWIASVFNSSTKVPDYEAFGFRALPVNNNTSTPAAKLDLFSGSGGPDGTLTDTGLSINSAGVITFVPSQTFNGSGIVMPATGSIILGGDTVLASYGDVSNTFVGGESGIDRATTGERNTALGYYSLDYNTTGASNVALGAFAMFKNTTGGGNIAIGDSAMWLSQTASNNLAIGGETLPSLTTGSYNVAIGTGSGQTPATDSSVTLVGSFTDAADGISNSTAIGTSASVTVSNAIVLGTTSAGGATAPAVGIGTTAPSHTLDVVDRGTAGAAIYASSTVVGDAAISGVNSATSGKGTNGGLFQSFSPNGSGVAAIDDVGGYAGYFEALDGGYAGYFAGNVTVTGNENVLGTLTKGGGSFKIDDPIDPSHKYLSHSFVESPDMKNIYDGIVTLDAHGSAVVTMPDWFSALNRDFRYQLTAIGAPGPKLYIAGEMHDNRFRIAGGKKGMRVSWEVTGIRQDAWANAHRIPNEEEKPANEQGKYLHPELFGAGPDKAVDSRGAINAQSPVPAPPDSQSTPSSPSTAIPGGR